MIKVEIPWANNAYQVSQFDTVELERPIRSWIRNHIVGPWEWTHYPHENRREWLLCFTFHDRDEAIRFKLTWG